MKEIFGQLNNQFVSGGLVLMLTGAALAFMRQLPVRAWGWLKRRATIEVEILNSDPLFDMVTIWLDQQPYSKRSRRLTATTSNASNKVDSAPLQIGEEAKRTPTKVFLTPAPGVHFFAYNGTFIWLSRHRESATPGQAGGGLSFFKPEQYDITAVGKNQQVIRSLIADIVECAVVQDETIRLYTASFGYWESQGNLKARPLESVILPHDTVRSVMSDLERFRASRDWYINVGIPWHRGYLLYGIPGSGKTSLVSGIAGKLGMDLYLMTLSTLNDESLVRLMSGIRSNTILLMEDVDCAMPERDHKSETTKVSMGALLNCIDGIQSREGCVVFMTTNHAEALDPALVRPGRIDMRVEFGKATRDQIERLRERIAPQINSVLAYEACAGKSMAEVQQWLLDAEPEESFAEYVESHAKTMQELGWAAKPRYPGPYRNPLEEGDKK